MQASLNHIDADKRNTNIIIAGMQEDDIVNNDDGELAEDHAKFKRLIQVMKVDNNIIAAADTFECSGIGQAKENTIRLLKVNVKSKATRDLILGKAPQLKESREP